MVLLHGFEQRRLCFRRRSVDFVRKYDVGEHRPMHKTEAPPSGLLVLLDDLRARDVRRHQVGRKLDSPEIGIERLCQRADEESLCEAGITYQQPKSSSVQANDERIDDIFLTDEQLRYLAA